MPVALVLDRSSVKSQASKDLLALAETTIASALCELRVDDLFVVTAGHSPSPATVTDPYELATSDAAGKSAFAESWPSCLLSPAVRALALALGEQSWHPSLCCHLFVVLDAASFDVSELGALVNDLSREFAMRLVFHSVVVCAGAMADPDVRVVETAALAALRQVCGAFGCGAMVELDTGAPHRASADLAAMLAADFAPFESVLTVGLSERFALALGLAPDPRLFQSAYYAALGLRLPVGLACVAFIARDAWLAAPALAVYQLEVLGVESAGATGAERTEPGTSHPPELSAVLATRTRAAMLYEALVGESLAGVVQLSAPTADAPGGWYAVLVAEKRARALSLVVLTPGASIPWLSAAPMGEFAVLPGDGTSASADETAAQQCGGAGAAELTPATRASTARLGAGSGVVPFYSHARVPSYAAGGNVTPSLAIAARASLQSEVRALARRLARHARPPRMDVPRLYSAVERVRCAAFHYGYPALLQLVPQLMGMLTAPGEVLDVSVSLALGDMLRQLTQHPERAITLPAL